MVEEMVPYMRRRFKLNGQKAALLVIDVQEYFRPLFSGILGNIKRLLWAFRTLERPVVFTVHGHRDPERDGGMLYRWWGELIREGTFDHRIVQELEPKEGEKILPKRRYSAFYGTDLEGYLRGLGVEEVVICGVMTNLCCETTARDAFMRDFLVFFVHDATATSLKELHLASLKNLAYGFAVVLSTEEVIKELGL